MILDFLYACVLLLISPWLVWRAYRTGRYRKDLASKLWGEVEAVPGSSRPVVWFHGVSVGEIQADFLLGRQNFDISSRGRRRGGMYRRMALPVTRNQKNLDRNHPPLA